MPRKPRSPKPTQASSKLLEAVQFVNLVCNDKGPVNETHMFICNGWIAASNGVLTAASQIDNAALFACPQSKLLLEALSKCGQDFKIENPFTIKSGKFKAVIPCVDYTLLFIPSPDTVTIEINDTLKEAIEAVSRLPNDNAQNIYGASILLNGQSIVATEKGVLLIEYWHGLDLPKGIVIPTDLIKPLLSIKKKLSKFGHSNNSVTFYFDDESWIKTQLFAEKWPDISGVFDRPSHQLPIPKDFWEGLEAVAPFSPDGLVHFAAGSLHSHAIEGAGASFEVAGLPAGPVFSARQLVIIRPLAETVDWFTPGTVGTMLTFQGKNVRGAIAGRSQ